MSDQRSASSSPRRAALGSDAQGWLRADKCGFLRFKHDDELEALFEAHGDGSTFWRRGMMLPVTLEELEPNEEAWLNSGDTSDYDAHSFFIHRFYNDDEKQTLWDERGDDKRFKWQSGMRKPELL